MSKQQCAGFCGKAYTQTTLSHFKLNNQPSGMCKLCTEINQSIQTGVPNPMAMERAFQKGYVIPVNTPGING